MKNHEEVCKKIIALHVLAEDKRTPNNERHAAWGRITVLCKKYGIVLEDLLRDQETQVFEIYISNQEHAKFVMQLLACLFSCDSQITRTAVIVGKWNVNKGRHVDELVRLNCKESEYQKLILWLGHYWPDLRERLKNSRQLIYRTFIHSNQLLPADAECMERHELSEIDRQVMQMAYGCPSKEKPLQQLGDGE